ncbi:MAG: 6-phosphogluconolactonase [Actinomycetaceae bacterium]|nr:6-phosphogluconolactonase [Actinomycetaceae bacterium]
MEFDVRIHRTPEELYAKSAVAFVRKIREISRHRSRVHVGLSGGSVAEGMLPKVASVLRANPHELDHWAPVHIWLVDERYVDYESPDRTDSIIDRELTSQFEIFTLHRPPQPGDYPDLRTATRAYEKYMIDTFSVSKRVDPRSIALDLAVLGMGPDGHFASLFPSHETLSHQSLMTYVKDSPKPPPQRMTMTVPFLRRSRNSWFIVAGSQKASVLSHALLGADFREVPAAAMNQVGTTWWCDDNAAHKIDRHI